uniref:26S proteasome non-ATPase regulatory subunit 9 n=1 Tax=Hucho hucho TaxID=62062 RepID=A0A4W5MV94_9TELE
MEAVQSLIKNKKKDHMEEQIKQGIGMEGPLVDAEGFPRTDVNVYQIRTARHSFSCLQNDHKAIMVEIEEALHRLHAREKTEQEVTLPSPFARVDAVSQGSPACQAVACLRVSDEIIAFGSVNTRNFQNLQNIASVVQHSEGKPLSVTVIRNGQKTQMGLTPQQWSGRGLLGVSFLPIELDIRLISI